MRVLAAAAAVAALIAVVAVLAPGSSGPAPPPAAATTEAAPAEAEAPAPCRGCFRPRPTTRPWQWQLQGRVDTSVEARVFDLDMDVASAVVRRLHRRGRKVVCYVDVGSWEPFRDDAGRFPPELLGRRFEGFEEERWLDVRRIDVLAPLLEARFDRCRRKGFDAVEPDNVDGYDNETGFSISYEDQIRFNRWVARAVRGRGMSVALKNDAAQARDLVRFFDFAIVEECFEQRACDAYRPFVRAGKAVFAAEYATRPSRFCRQARRLKISAIYKRPTLGAFRRTC